MGSSNIRICFLIILLSSPVAELFAEIQTIYMRNGQILRGEVIQQTATTMQIKMEDGKVKQLNKKEIQRVSYKEPTVQEKKESEEKLKQQTAVVEEPPPPTPEVSKTPEPEINKAVSPYAIDQVKRKDIELFFGAGLGTYRPPTESYLNQTSVKANVLTGQLPPDHDSPSYKRGLAYSMGAIYYWKKFAFGISANHFGGETSERIKVYNPNATLQEIAGKFPEKQSSLKADISYLAYSNQRIDLRPSFGYSQFWGKTDDNNTISTGYNGNELTSFFKYHYYFLEKLKGPSIGLKTTVRQGERWEHRIELHYLMLSGAQYSNGTLSMFNPPNFFDFGVIRGSIQWDAKGFNFSYKLFYKWTPTISFWVGIQAFEWKYSLKSLDQSFDGLANIDNPSPVDQLVLINLLLTSTAKMTPATSKASSLEFGVMKRFELSQ
ncbi:LA_0442/LA_0875 N-terminal domain-containing protein [Leptospira koniambonensis]|uniref:LA_0442/LA_0875 N-terminal domain-containing protein n=1 Tax=Leptospira koniambonensis TaxID=2484950 RepID=UPI003EBE9CE6